MTLLIQLFLAHLAGDFLLQPRRWAEAKEIRKLRSWQFYAHVCIHFALVLLVTGDTRLLLPAGVIALSHAFIDLMKVYLQSERTRRRWFFADQALHLFVIASVAWYLERPEFAFPGELPQPLLYLITAIVFLTVPSAVIVRMAISQWAPARPGDASGASLPDAGMYIGILERLFILVFILTNHWEGVGFLIAAKSVFRFGDLRGSHDRTLTEYVLIGTLLSFAIAIATAVLAQHLIN